MTADGITSRRLRASNMISLHDHHIREFSVDVANKRLQLVTELPSDRSARWAIAVFEGVEAYVIDGDMMGTIIFEIVEVEPVALYDGRAETMQATYHRSGGHAPWAGSREDALRFFGAHDVRGFDLSSSIGCTAAIWAHSYRVESSR
jgi:hypothetical protein